MFLVLRNAILYPLCLLIFTYFFKEYCTSNPVSKLVEELKNPNNFIFLPTGAGILAFCYNMGLKDVILASITEFKSVSIKTKGENIYNDAFTKSEILLNSFKINYKLISTIYMLFIVACPFTCIFFGVSNFIINAHILILFCFVSISYVCVRIYWAEKTILKHKIPLQ